MMSSQHNRVCRQLDSLGRQLAHRIMTDW